MLAPIEEHEEDLGYGFDGMMDNYEEMTGPTYGASGSGKDTLN